MKRKEAIKGTREGVIQIFNDYHPSTKEIKKFLKEAFPNDEDNFCIEKYFKKLNDYGNWIGSEEPYKNIPIINLSTITKRKKTKLSQLEKLVSDVVKDVAELRQTIAKDVEVVVEEVESELVVGEWYKSESERGCTYALFQGFDVITYGITHFGDFIKEAEWFFKKDKIIYDNFGINLEFLKLATPQEVQTALENEAKKRGYKEGDDVGNFNGLEKELINSNRYEFTGGLFFMGGACIMENGIWAEIIQKETIKEEEIDWIKQAELIAKKYVYGNHDALTDRQEVEYMKDDIILLLNKFKGELTIK